MPVGDFNLVSLLGLKTAVEPMTGPRCGFGHGGFTGYVAAELSASDQPATGSRLSWLEGPNPQWEMPKNIIPAMGPRFGVSMKRPLEVKGCPLINEVGVSGG